MPLPRPLGLLAESHLSISVHSLALHRRHSAAVPVRTAPTGTGRGHHATSTHTTNKPITPTGTGTGAGTVPGTSQVRTEPLRTFFLCACIHREAKLACMSMHRCLFTLIDWMCGLRPSCDRVHATRPHGLKLNGVSCLPRPTCLGCRALLWLHVHE